MWTRCFERGSLVINISDYGFETYLGHKMIHSGLIDPEQKEEVIQMLLEDGFTEVV